MKTGIYINGLGQSVADESCHSYTQRFAEELNQHDDFYDYLVHMEKVEYLPTRQSNVSIIMQRNRQTGLSTPYYKMYEFKYNDLLIGNYTSKNLLQKNWSLLSVVLSKFPLMVWRIFKPTKQYTSTLQTLYVFFLFLLIACSIVLMIPSAAGILLSDEFVQKSEWLAHLKNSMLDEHSFYIRASKFFVPFTTLILLLVPKAKLMVTQISAEFVSTHLYLQFAQRKGEIVGYMRHLYEHIVSADPEAKICIHAYSFGTIVALDVLYPFKQEPTGNVLNYTVGLVTIATPYDFINTYYPNYYLHRGIAIEKPGYAWINVYSTHDVLSSNFRYGAEAGVAEYGVLQDSRPPHNVNYEVIQTDQMGVFNYLLLSNLKVHGMYWPDDVYGSSCVGMLYIKMKELGML
ncbi:hypothetical protein [Flavobacterium sp. N1719]|uniref:hypothetical protein n=1 Tax=Flavobacterium sp. N1719 TaxID=2885633 RepID=UPI0022217427|nr:hypothetical protein [Flavobacterium sp. N1719]